MANLSEDIQCAGSDHDHYQEAACAHHEDHMMHDSVQLYHVVDSHADNTSDSNIILYDQYVKDNEVPVVHSDVSCVPIDAFMMIYDDMCEPHDQSISYPSRNTTVHNSLTAELATYKEHVELYKQQAKFELTEREQKINDQLRIVISDRNFKKETLKRELQSIKLQLASTINHNKSMVEKASFLKKDFKQKENKYLAEFLDMKTLKEKVEDKLIKQDQSFQIVHMLCRLRTNSNELNRVAIGYKNPLCLTRTKQVQPALYNGHEIIKDNHTPAIVHNSEDTLEIADIIRKKMNDKMNDPECVTRKVKIAPHDYSKENLLATFTPQFLGLQVNQFPCGIFINKSKYVLEILKKYGMESCDPIGTPLEIKDKLDLDQNGTPDSGFELTEFSDADYAGCKDTFKSTSGGGQFLGEKLVSWSSKKQDCTALSTVEAEYVSLSACCAQVLWMQTQLTDYGFHFNKIPIYCDWKSSIAISCNPVQHSRTKHIAVRYHFIKKHVEKGTIELYFVKTDYQLADIFTKALLADRFNYMVHRLGMRSLSPKELERLAKSL
nr:retrotransposon protein, putative, unclassified [Tanacetum cinerariifolium]